MNELNVKVIVKQKGVRGSSFASPVTAMAMAGFQSDDGGRFYLRGLGMPDESVARQLA